MKKILALVLALALCAGLCACGQEKAPESEGPRSDVSVTPIPKPDGSGSGKTDAPAAPAVTETPAPPDILVTDKCAISGTLTYDDGYRDYFSYTLPEIGGVSTDYILAVGKEIDDIYDEYVMRSLEAMQDPEGFPVHFCTAYSHAETGGVHSLLITCDSEWGDDQYWCFSFDAWGGEVDNEALLSLVGLTPDRFVKTVRDYLTELTDFSAYFDDDDSWKELQEQTIADDNCNADMPMALLPDGSLCFIATVYTPAGAGVYDYALALRSDGEISDVRLGSIAENQLWGTYLVDTQDTGEDGGDTEYMLEFLRIGDTLSAQVTAFEPESGGVLYYYAADIYPEDPADLLRADGAPIPVRVLSYCPDVFTGTYYGEAGLYTMTVSEDGVAFSDFRGGTPFVAEEFTAEYRYDEDFLLESSFPETDHERFDYSLIYDSGIAGVWTGNYTDTDYRVHSLTLELTTYGDLWMRDCVDGEIPRVLGGSYYISGADDDIASEEGMTVFSLAAVGGYKMPVVGACWISVDEDGDLKVYDDDESYTSMLLAPTDYYCYLSRVPALRVNTEKRAVTPLAEGERFEADIRGDGMTTEYSYTLVRDENAGNAITSIILSLDGEEVSLDDLWIYEAEVYAVEPGYTGAVYFYIDGLSDNDYHYTDIVAADETRFWYVGSFPYGFDGEPSDSECMMLRKRFALLSTVSIYRSYRVGAGGMPEAIDPFFYTDAKTTLTAKKDIDAWKADSESGEIYYDQVIEAGTKLTFLRTDGSTFWDLLAGNGDCYRVWVDDSDWPQTINGAPIEDCFDGTVFAG